MKRFCLLLFTFLYISVTSSLFHVFAMGHTMSHTVLSTHHNDTILHICDDANVGGCADMCMMIEHIKSTAYIGSVEPIVIPLAILPSFGLSSKLARNKNTVFLYDTTIPHKQFFSVILVGVQKLTI